MSSISGDTSSITGAALTPAQLADESLLGKPNANPITADEAPQEQADATVLDLSAGSSGTVASDLEASVPSDFASASAVVSDLAGSITQQGSQASTAHSPLSAASTLKLTRQ